MRPRLQDEDGETIAGDKLLVPWRPMNTQDPHSNFRVCPVTVAGPHAVRFNDKNTRAPDTPAPTSWRASQNTAAMPDAYGTLYDRNLMASDSLYAILELLSSVAAAENQVLNLIKDLIHGEHAEREFSQTQPCTSSAIFRIQVLKMAVEKRQEKISQAARLLGDLDFWDWPYAADPDGTQPTRRLAKHRPAIHEARRVAKDFAYLDSQAQKLSTRCHALIAELAHDDSVRESGRASERATQSLKLGIAGLFIMTLGTVCAILGQNFMELGQGTLHFWIFVPVAIGGLLVIYALCLWLELLTLAQLWEILKGSVRAFVHGLRRLAGAVRRFGRQREEAQESEGSQEGRGQPGGAVKDKDGPGEEPGSRVPRTNQILRRR